MLARLPRVVTAEAAMPTAAAIGPGDHVTTQSAAAIDGPWPAYDAPLDPLSHEQPGDWPAQATQPAYDESRAGRPVSARRHRIDPADHRQPAAPMPAMMRVPTTQAASPDWLADRILPWWAAAAPNASTVASALLAFMAGVLCWLV
ncbi:MAG: hypothetical protein DCC67_11810, partial [Planctomycetota bacterium]